MQYIVSHENQNIPIPAELALNEANLRRALATIIPGIAEAKINSTFKDDLTTITIVKTAGTKGADPLSHLIQAAGGMNPVFVCYEKLKQIDPAALSAADIVLLDQQIEAAIESGEGQRDKIKTAFNRLKSATPQPSPVVILGF